jgi:hypothetical protein
LGDGVDARRRFIEHDHIRAPQQGAGDRQQLRLPGFTESASYTIPQPEAG